MRRLLVLACLFVLLVPVASGATSKQFGFKGGMALADLTGDDVDGDATDMRNGFVGGVYFQAGFTPSIAVRLEGLYHMKGAEADSADFTATFKLDYVEFPLLLVAEVPASETATLQFFGGPVVGFNSNAELEGSVGDLTASVDIGDFVADVEFALALGAGVSFEAGSVLVGLDGRYDLGLTSIDDEDEADIKNKGFSIMASVGFPIGGDAAP